MNKRKIRILTFWNVPNYGSFLQAYALQKIMQKKFESYDVRQISYLNKKHFEVYYSLLNKNFKLWPINPKFYLNNRNLKERKRQVEQSKKFLKYYTKIPSDNECVRNNADEIDYLILGSDIIWDYSIGFISDPYLFGCGIKAKKKISYAPSFGTVSLGNESPAFVKDGLQKLNRISVRDNKSKLIVKNLSDLDAEIVLDPTLIWDFNIDDNVVDPKIRNYVVVYGSYFPKELVDEASIYCRTYNLKLICLSSLNDNYEWCDQIINQDELDPFEWAGFFKHSSAIMTCTYHGLLFGLNYKKPIIFNPTNFVLNKMDLIINCFGLEDVLLRKESFIDKIEWNWDYSRIDKIIDEYRKKSLLFLDEAINDEQQY